MVETIQPFLPVPGVCPACAGALKHCRFLACVERWSRANARHWPKSPSKFLCLNHCTDGLCNRSIKINCVLSARNLGLSNPMLFVMQCCICPLPFFDATNW